MSANADAPERQGYVQDDGLEKAKIPFSETVSDAMNLIAPEEAPSEASVSEEPAAESDDQQETGFEIPNLDVDVPEDYREISEMPDFDAEAEAELQREENTQQENNDYEYEDQNVAEERRKRIAAEKRSLWLEEQHLRQNEGKWRAEATKYYPLAQPFIDAGMIQADSRRAYAREAKKVHEALKPFIAERFLKPLEEALKAKEAEVKEEQTAETARQWGKPLTGPSQVPAAATRQAEQFDGRRRSATLVDEIKTLMFEGGGQ